MYAQKVRRFRARVLKQIFDLNPLCIVPVNGQRYRGMISDFLRPRSKELEMGVDLNILWTLNDCNRTEQHISRDTTIALLMESSGIDNAGHHGFAT